MTPKPATIAEFPHAGVALVEFRAAALSVNACLLTAIQVTTQFDPRKAALLEIVRLAVMERIAIADCALSAAPCQVGES